MIMATMPERKSTIISELMMENQWICSSPISRYVSHRLAHLMSECSHFTSYVNTTSPGLVSGCGPAPPLHEVSLGGDASFHAPLYACFTLLGSTSKPTIREPSNDGSLWYLTVIATWLLRYETPSSVLGISVEPLKPIGKPTSYTVTGAPGTLSSTNLVAAGRLSRIQCTRYSSATRRLKSCTSSVVSSLRQSTLHVSSTPILRSYSELTIRSPRSTSPRFSATFSIAPGLQYGML